MFHLATSRPLEGLAVPTQMHVIPRRGNRARVYGRRAYRVSCNVSAPTRLRGSVDPVRIECAMALARCAYTLVRPSSRCVRGYRAPESEDPHQRQQCSGSWICGWPLYLPRLRVVSYTRPQLSASACWHPSQMECLCASTRSDLPGENAFRCV